MNPVPPRIRRRNGFVVFFSALALGRSPKPNAPTAAAESLRNFLLVVDIMESWSMIGVFQKRNRWDRSDLAMTRPVYH